MSLAFRSPTVLGKSIEIWYTGNEGWIYPKLTVSQIDALEFRAWIEGENGGPWYLQLKAEREQSPADAESLLRGLLLDTAEALKVKVSFRWAEETASRLLHNSVDNVRGTFCFVPGYHSNFTEDDPRHRTRRMLDIYLMAGRIILREKRPWYKHPRWHFWHWKVKIV